MSFASATTAFRPFVVVALGASLLLACTVDEGTKRRRAPSSPDADYWADPITTDEDSIEPDRVNDNSGAFGAGARPSTSSSGGALLPKDGGTNVAPKAYCAAPLAAGDLAIVEIMITATSGSGDSGEWVEIQSTRDCTLRLEGLSIESPRGALAPNVATITDAFDLPPHGTFLVADSADPAKNNGLPGKVIAWNASDVLRNDGDTLHLKLRGVTVDSFTYPSLSNLTAGRSFSFPSDCTWTERKTWSRWSLTFDEYRPGFRGTPNGVNGDVSCF